jgi:hypothetical protein
MVRQVLASTASAIVLFGFCIVFASSADPISLGSLATWNFNGLRSDDITILNSKQMKIEDLHFTDEGPAVWFMVGTDSKSEYSKEFSPLDGTIIPDEDGRYLILKY